MSLSIVLVDLGQDVFSLGASVSNASEKVFKITFSPSTLVGHTTLRRPSILQPSMKRALI